MIKKEPASNREVQDLLDKFEDAIQQLKVAYDKYFTGVDRIAPQDLSGRVQRLLRQCEATRPSRTVLRFRLNSLRARLVSYRHYWTRVLGQIENGTYPRHIQRAQRRMRERRASTPTPAAEASPGAQGRSAADPDGTLGDTLGVAAQGGSGEATRDAGPDPTPDPTPRGDRPEKVRTPLQPPAQSVPGMEPNRVRALYDELVRAKRAAGEDTRGLTYRGLCKQLARDAPKLRKKHGEITFVVSKDGGPVRLKAKVGGAG